MLSFEHEKWDGDLKKPDSIRNSQVLNVSLFPFNVSEDEMSAATAAAASLSSLLASTAASTNGANGNRPKSPPETPNRLASSSPPAPPVAAPHGGGGGGDGHHLRSSSSPGISYEGMVSVMSARGTGGPSAGNAASDAEVSTTRENDSSPPSAGSSSRFDIY